MTAVTVLGRWDDLNPPAWLDRLWQDGIQLEDCCDAEVPGQFNPEPTFPGTIPSPCITIQLPSGEPAELAVGGCYRKAGHSGRHFGLAFTDTTDKSGDHLIVWGPKLPSHLQRLDARLRRDFGFAAEPWQLEVTYNALQNPGVPVRLLRSRTYDYAKGLTL